jgi:serine/threonine-protein kinase
MLYELMAGQVPFRGENEVATLYKTAYEDPPEIRERCAISEAFARVIDRALEKEPAARFQDAKEMRAALQACLGRAPSPSGESPQLPTATLMLPPLPETPPLGETRTEPGRLAPFATGQAALPRAINAAPRSWFVGALLAVLLAIAALSSFIIARLLDDAGSPPPKETVAAEPPVVVAPPPPVASAVLAEPPPKPRVIASPEEPTPRLPPKPVPPKPHAHRAPNILDLRVEDLARPAASKARE